ncbi:NAD(P)/FAD-dependent oxidoreductase [Streptacidiphilus jiangxiensis]|uniref:Dehydrogenase (Flavoprotein) n=1 Tax=Streptacidiphilus jiangxiensis TaxID=235985 RepID=A0A1H7KWK3_STRJI|nr:NAD(P)/FAD-dependent oxidoreductase [Streptacidiphilus jiangxiensis]SEK91179.1 Dehydrogenase (flavoprotein) [Streptacidiphilus jiangxiensis]
MSTTEIDQSQFDVAVVGGSIAGCATAIRFSQMGYRVGIFDKKPMNDEFHKRLCTHFIQPHSVPLLAGLGLAHLTEPEWSVRTKAVFVTPGGVIDGPGGYVAGPPDSYALNLERRVLDPALRAAARKQGVQYLDSTLVESLVEDESGWILDTTGESGSQRFRARLVVAADGRRSSLAKELGNPAESHPNDRAALFGYFTGIRPREDNRSIFIMNDRDLACVYPLVGGRTQLVLFAEKSRVEGWSGQDGRLREFLKYFDDLADAPSTAEAVPESGLLGYTDYPSQVRQPVVGSVPFVGDAALSVDAMSGVGCGFALVTADLLAQSFADRSLDKAGVADGLEEYRRRYAETVQPHIEGIYGDSLVEKNEATRKRMFTTICASEDLSQKYLSLSGRLLMPGEFQRDLMRALMTRGSAGLKR